MALSPQLQSCTIRVRRYNTPPRLKTRGNGVMDKKKYDHEKQKYEREIEEILSKYDMETDRKEKPRLPAIPPGGFQTRKPYASGRSWSLPKNWRRFGSGQYIAAAFVAAFLAVLVRGVSPVLTSLLIIAAI